VISARLHVPVMRKTTVRKGQTTAARMTASTVRLLDPPA
jgi:hypothetical protein